MPPSHFRIRLNMGSTWSRLIFRRSNQFLLPAFLCLSLRERIEVREIFWFLSPATDRVDAFHQGDRFPLRYHVEGRGVLYELFSTPQKVRHTAHSMSSRHFREPNSGADLPRRRTHYSVICP